MYKSFKLRIVCAACCVIVLVASFAGATTSDTPPSDKNIISAFSTIGIILSVIIPATVVGGYIVKLTNAINRLEAGLQKKIDGARDVLAKEIYQTRDELSREIYQNRTEIAEFRHLQLLQHTTVSKDIENNYKEQSIQLINLSKKVYDLERFAAKTTSYNPKLSTPPENTTL